MTKRIGLVLVLASIGGCEAPDTTPRDAERVSSESQPRNGEQYLPCGTPLAEVDGVWAYSNGANTGTEYSCAGLTAINTYAYQCVEFAQRYMHETFGLPQRWNVERAKQMCTSYPGGVAPIAAGALPVRGDLAVFTNGSSGHVAVVAEVFADGISIVEQNASASGTRILYGDPWGGYWTSYNTSPTCFMHADANGGGGGGGGAAPPPVQPPPAPTGAQCDALGYFGDCRGDTSVWSENGACLVRDCASEGKTCGLISDAAGMGCLGGNDGSTAFDCAALDYVGTCLQDGTLVWVEGAECKAVHCPASGRSCGWDDAIGYNCL